ncbi:fatty acid desaturase 4-like 1, chloroplastic [Lycium ferocissimum]|uniref:fatty acid desaturase 4-like 1, chloroplastic n=1 Tax=Lycium ferocissimum TaxID=112874 RepID=UPI0028168C04|nr:fatty acid desaturase 4-like 1, chloroplastic [Lycium ferocissimum]
MATYPIRVAFIKNFFSLHSLNNISLILYALLLGILIVHPTLSFFNVSSILPQNHVTKSSQRSDEIGTIQRKSSHPDKSISHQLEPANYEPPTPITKTGTSTRSHVLNDPSLQSTWAEQAWMVSGCTTVFISLAKSATGAVNSHSWVGPLIACCIGYVLSDLANGIYHWAIDNYGNAKTPVFGSQIDAFLRHHKSPLTITRLQFATNLHELARAVTFIVLPINLLCNNPTILAFMGVFSGFTMFGIQIHSWAHGTKSKLPSIVLVLQDAGIILSRSNHAVHHLPPYNNSYCTVSGLWNQYLDRYKVFELLENTFFYKFGVRPRSWSEPNTKWTEETEGLESLPASH